MEAQKGGKRRLVLGIFAQVDAGKTTLSEALLYKAGALRTLGRVDRGDAHLDTHELERARGITIFSKQARFETERLAVTLLDTPGHADFAPEAERVMPVIDCALLLVSGTDGVQGHTLTLWRLLQGRAPVSELRDYARDVAAYTRGRGRLSCEVAGYFPCHNTEAVVAALAYDPAADLENTPDSVFCSHGAGITIPWDQVEENMHLESVLRPKPAAAPAAAPRVRTQNLDLDEKELQRIIEREFGPQKTPLYRPPAAKAEAAVTLPPRRKEYLIVDGYNMIFAWDGLREQAGYDLSGARERLLDLLSNYCGFHPCELIVVFDSYRVRGGTGSRSSHNNLRVVYTQEDESADLYIETLVGKIGKNYAVRVATSDALIQLSALRSGVLRVSAAELERELERTNGEIAAVLRRLREEARHAAGQESPLRALDPKSNPDKEEPI